MRIKISKANNQSNYWRPILLFIRFHQGDSKNPGCRLQVKILTLKKNNNEVGRSKEHRPCGWHVQWLNCPGNILKTGMLQQK